MVKILHCGDFHFDTPFAELSGEDAQQRREDLRETMGRVVALAEREKVDCLLISGDLFDHQRISSMTLEDLRKKFESIPHIPIFIAPGNHDPNNETSYYQLVSWPEHVHIFTGACEKVVLKGLNTCIYGCGFQTPIQRESLLAGFRVADPRHINIMVMHGDVGPTGQPSDYNPISLKDIEMSGLDYLALGHRHSATAVHRAGSSFWAYCGCPEGRGFDELGDKGVLLGTVVKGSCHLAFHSICKRRYEQLEIEVSGCIGYDDLAQRILQGVEDNQPERNLFKLILKGQVSPGLLIYPQVLKEKLQDRLFFCKLQDETQGIRDLETLSKETSLKGLFIKLIHEKAQEPLSPTERRKLELALKYGLQSLEQGKVELS